MPWEPKLKDVVNGLDRGRGLLSAEREGSGLQTVWNLSLDLATFLSIGELLPILQNPNPALTSIMNVFEPLISSIYAGFLFSQPPNHP